MAKTQVTKKSSNILKLSDQSSRQKSKIDLQKESNIDKQKKSINHSSTSIDNIKKDCPPMSVLSELDFPREPVILPTSDPEELQNLLLCELFYYKKIKVFIM